ncbi:single-stranded DNA-binding protein [Denitrobacterium detoxificans]|uniref:single-stranded DNA-binding protein n=1 Tax=Denitrobacterium detoxificans TaxID=79604 RepID=UPI0007C9BB3B|nr:single-stranded DNA-binding protein [Denitrobacterium detoxificans]ANE22565.1 single-stranded DNA-binding protein [Denitrobacterium detoxificans]
MSINKVIITGNLTREPDLRQTASGMAVLGFGVAVNERRKNSQTGEWEDFPNYVDCTMFGSRAQGIAPYLTKGGKVAIEGHLRWSQWERDGQKRSKLEVLVDEIELMSQSRSKAANAPQGGTGAESAQTAPSAAGEQPQTAYEADMYECDIPF